MATPEWPSRHACPMRNTPLRSSRVHGHISCPPHLGRRTPATSVRPAAELSPHARCAYRPRDVNSAVRRLRPSRATIRMSARPLPRFSYDLNSAIRYDVNSPLIGSGAPVRSKPARCRRRVGAAAKTARARHGGRGRSSGLGAWLRERPGPCVRSEHEKSGAHARCPRERRCTPGPRALRPAVGHSVPCPLHRQPWRGVADNLDMSLPRAIVPGCRYMITRRCSERRFLHAPRPGNQTTPSFIASPSLLARPESASSASAR